MFAARTGIIISSCVGIAHLFSLHYCPIDTGSAAVTANVSRMLTGMLIRLSPSADFRLRLFNGQSNLSFFIHRNNFHFYLIMQFKVIIHIAHIFPGNFRNMDQADFFIGDFHKHTEFCQTSNSAFNDTSDF